MATIAFYANKVNRMPGLIRDVKKSVLDYKAELAALKNKSLKINQSICNTDDVISSIQASTQTQEEKIDSLEAFRQKNEEFVEDTVRIDNEVAEAIRRRKPPQYDKALYHNKGKKIKGAKPKSAAPKDGQASLNKSIPVKPTTTRRISVEGDKFVVFDETSPGIFHGHIREWSQLTDAMKNALKNAGLVNKRGKIL